MKQTMDFNKLQVMVDIESMSKRFDAAIVSIAANTFSLDKGIGNVFYINVDLESCESKGLRISGDTVTWWLKKSKEAQNKLFDPNPVSLVFALFELNKWFENIHEIEPIPNVWSKGNFDIPILENAYRAVNTKHPWHYRHIQDLRVLCNITNVNTDDFNAGIKHSAESDAFNQSSAALLAFQRFVNMIKIYNHE
jgi:hypothetical protein